MSKPLRPGRWRAKKGDGQQYGQGQEGRGRDGDAVRGRRKPAFFDAEWYLAAHPDVAAAGLAPLRHYLRHGRREGRPPCALTAPDRERDLRLGLSPEAELVALAGGAAAADRVWARVALARRAAWAGDWPRAQDWLAPLSPAEVTGFALPDPVLLAAEVALVAGDPARARAILAAGAQALPRSTDLVLARANLAAGDAAWRRALLGAYLRAGLMPPALAPEGAPGQPRFDRLCAPLLPRAGSSGRGGPLVSVIMPARNAGATIGTALAGLLAQSWRALEILVIDNGSTDDTAARVHAQAARDPRIRLIDAADADGAYGARNRGLAAAQGALITTHDADDWSHPARIARQVAALLRRPGAMASASHWVRATPGLRFTQWWGGTGLVHPNISSLMIRRAAVEKLGFWDRARAGADSEYWDRLRAVFGPETILAVDPGLPLAFGRQAGASLSRASATAVETLLAGPRRDYLLAARAWHRAPDLPLPERPAHRPFALPPALALGDPPPQRRTERDRLLASPHFDAAWRQATDPLLRITGADPAQHYLDEGAALGQDPGPGFSTSGFALAEGVAPADLDPARLLDRLADPAPYLPDIPGALPDTGAPRVLVFGHRAGAAVFGAERSLLDMLDRVAQAGLVPLAVLPGAGGADYRAAVLARCARLYIRPYGWRQGGIAPHPGTVAGLAGLIRGSGAAEVHVNTLVLDAPLAAVRAAGVPATVWVRELIAHDPQLARALSLRPEALRAALLAGADRLVANSGAVAGWLGPEAAGRVTVLPNPVDPALFALPDPPSGPAPRFALIGALEAAKGLHEVVALARKLPGTRFVLVGPESAPLAALRAKARLPGNVVPAGYAATPAQALAQADVVLSLSRVAESFGRTVIEALAAGRPVICWDRGTPPELVGRDGRAGLVVPAGDMAAAVAAIRRLSAPGAAAAMAPAARARARALDAQRAAVRDADLFFSAGSGAGRDGPL